MNSFSAAQAVPSNSGGEMHLSHALDLDQVLNYLEAMHQIRKDTGMYVRLTNPLPYCSVWESRPHLRSLVESSTCTAGRSIIQIDPSGNVKPCPMVNNSYGNILEDGLDKVWNGMSEWSEDKYVPKTCEPCDLVEICKGACRAEAERMAGSLDVKHPYSIKPVKLTQLEIKKSEFNVGDKFYTARDLQVRREDENNYTFFARDRYLIADETASRFISVIDKRKGITADEKLVNNAHAVEVLRTGLESGILLKA
jgi:radical SAM protein with 4Fe4S-binding SPASM domain